MKPTIQHNRIAAPSERIEQRVAKWTACGKEIVVTVSSELTEDTSVNSAN